MRIVDRSGHEWAHVAWDGETFAGLTVPGARVHAEVTHDPIAGDAHVIDSAGACTAMSAIDWARPTRIPTVANPGALAPGAGGAILNAIAVLAARAGVPALRYAGPYPTNALWSALARSFRTTASEHAFTQDFVERAARLARDEIAIDFQPAPHERLAIIAGAARGHVELRDGVERAVIDGVAYERDGSPARLVRDGDTARAEVWFGDALYAHVATFAPDGNTVDGPHAVPPSTSTVLGQEFPPALASAIGELVAQVVAAPLADDVRRYLATRPIVWADLGARAAHATGDAIELHAALWDRIGPLGLGRLALALAEALAPVATQAVVAAVMARR